MPAHGRPPTLGPSINLARRTTMVPITTVRRTSVALLFAFAAAACSTSAGASGTPPPSLPSAPGSTPAPTGPIQVSLDQASGSAVTIEVTDGSGHLLSAASGTPGDGASVEPYTVAVSNVDASTLRLTWVDGPCDSASTLTIDASARRFLLVQPECSGDAVAFDRVLELYFDRPIDAGQIEISLQDGIDTAG
jgi:hypothetical protein